MQKIQFYLLSNRITVTTDLVGSGYITEYRKVYQRKLKIYKGIDNTIEFEVRNADNRKDASTVNYDIVLKFYDAAQQNLFTVSGSSLLPGIMSATIPKDVIQNIDPQQLRMAAYLRNDTTEKILYSDSQFDLFGTVELFDGFNDKNAFGDVISELTVFNYEYDRKSYVSEIAPFGTIINDDQSTTTDSVEVEIHNNLNAIYEGPITVQATTQISTGLTNEISWDHIDTINVVWDGSNRITRKTIYKQDKNGIVKDYQFIRFIIPKIDTGTGASFEVSRLGGVYTVNNVIRGGTNYTVGDRIKILGSKLDGVDGVHDLILTVTAISSTPETGKKAVESVTASGTAVAGTGVYKPITGTSFTGTIDKILLRN